MTEGRGAVESIRVVLVETSHPGNIGAVARAMKTMGLANLHLVRPARFPCAEATARAAGADDILYHAEVSDSLPEALHGAALVVGTSARARHLEWPAWTPRECAARLVDTASSAPAAIVFGRESTGLSNQELELCQATVRIPTNPAFSSLNVAAAVQILCYEIRIALGEDPAAAPAPADRPVTTEEIEGLYEHLRRTLVAIGYLDEAAPKLLMRRLRRLFNRAGLERAELKILRGVLSAVERRCRPE